MFDPFLMMVYGIWWVLAPYGVGVHSGGVDGTRKPVDDVV